jgi:hypothetical protein
VRRFERDEGRERVIRPHAFDDVISVGFQIDLAKTCPVAADLGAQRCLIVNDLLLSFLMFRIS